MSSGKQSVGHSDHLDWNECSQCGAMVTDLDAGFSPAELGMRCPCGGRWRRPRAGGPDRVQSPADEGRHGQR